MKLVPLVSCLPLLAFLGLAPSALAQQQLRQGVPDIQEVSGHTIRIFRMGRNSYGYEIRRGPVVLVHQRRNPFTGSQMGLNRKEDALKTATWLLDTVLMREQMLPRSRRLPEGSALTRSIPSTVAATLGVALDKTR